MKRNVEITEIFDGRFYEPEDMVKIGCRECENCADCCRQTGDSIILDPYDLYHLQKGIGKTFEDMIEKEIEIRMVDGLILPNIMQEGHDGCPFLNKNDRCSIHPYRPGFCRLFPMGRYYVKKPEKGFFYFLQKDECSKLDGELYEVRLKDWLDTQDLPKYETYILDWHFFLEEAGEKLSRLNETMQEQGARYLLQLFYVNVYDVKREFYPQFAERLDHAKQVFARIK